MDESNEHKIYESGARRSKSEAEQYGFHLFHPIILLRVAKVWKEAAYTKYGPHNWEIGLSIQDCIDHAWTHYCKWITGDTLEDHLGHLLCNFMIIMVLEETHPELMKGIKWDGYKATPEMEEIWKEFQAKLKNAKEPSNTFDTSTRVKTQIAQILENYTVRTPSASIPYIALYAKYLSEYSEPVSRQDFFECLQSSFGGLLNYAWKEGAFFSTYYLTRQPLNPCVMLDWVHTHTEFCPNRNLPFDNVLNAYTVFVAEPFKDDKVKEWTIIMQRLFETEEIDGHLYFKDRNFK